MFRFLLGLFLVIFANKALACADPNTETHTIVIGIAVIILMLSAILLLISGILYDNRVKMKEILTVIFTSMSGIAVTIFIMLNMNSSIDESYILLLLCIFVSLPTLYILLKQ